LPLIYRGALTDSGETGPGMGAESLAYEMSIQKGGLWQSPLANQNKHTKEKEVERQ
jgi:hypothetical protein